MSATKVEMLWWHRITDAPDDGETVLVQCSDEEVYQGFLDGTVWRDAQGMPLPSPLYWAPWPFGPEFESSRPIGVKPGQRSGAYGSAGHSVGHRTGHAVAPDSLPDLPTGGGR